MSVVQFLPSTTTNASTTTVTQTAGISLPVGSYIVVVCGTNSSLNSTGVSDSVGNTYNLVANSGINQNVQAYACLVGVPIVSGSTTITGTFLSATTAQKNLIGWWFQGGIVTDFGTSNNGSSITATVSATANHTNELLFAVIQGGTPNNAFASPAGYTFNGGVFPGGGASTTAGYWSYITSPAGLQSLSSNLGNTQQWAMLFIGVQATLLQSPPAIPQFAAGYPYLPTDFDNLIQNPVAFQTSGVMFRAEKHGSQSLTSGTNNVIQFDFIQEDPYAGWVGSSTWKWFAPFTGWYLITLSGSVNAVPGQLAPIIQTPEFEFVGSSSNMNATIPGIATATIFLPMIAGVDSVQGLLFSSATATISTTNGRYSSMEIRFISQ